MRLDKDASAEAYAVADVDLAGGDDGRAEAAMAAQHAVMLDTAVGADEVVVADASAGADITECQDQIALAQRDIGPDDGTGVDDVGERDAACVPLVEDALAEGNARADGDQRGVERAVALQRDSALDIDAADHRHTADCLLR